MSNIRISQLNSFTAIQGEDYLALVESSSMTTFKVTVTSLSDWFAVSGSALSSSFASRSLTATSASWASASTQAISASFLISSSINGTASYAVNGLSASYALSASNAKTASFSISGAFSSNSLSASYAKSASRADTASYVNIIPQTSASWASQSLSSSISITASYAKSSSIADTASYVVGGLSSNIAFATCYWQRSQIGNMQFIGSKGIYSASYRGAVSQVGIPASTSSYGALTTWIIYMNTAMPTTGYTVLSGMGGEPGREYLEVTNYPFSARTTTAFSVSMNNFGGGGFNDSVSEPAWFSLMVLHP
jgi:hypothetical protein